MVLFEAHKQLCSLSAVKIDDLHRLSPLVEFESSNGAL